MSVNSTKYGVDTGSRVPFIPNDESVENCMEGKLRYPTSDRVATEVLFGHTIIRGYEELGEFDDPQKAIQLIKSITHAMKKIFIVAHQPLYISAGSQIVGEEVYIYAPVVKIFDDNTTYYRTTLVAKNILVIEAKELYVDGADIIFPAKHELKIDSIFLKNTTLNTRWLAGVVRDKKLM